MTGAKDPDFWSARVNLDLRIILHGAGENVVLCYVDRHDDADQWAERRKLEFHPNTGEIRSDGPDGIACWFIDTDYNQESFFVRHAYFLGASDPYKSLKTTLKAEIDADAWATLNSDTSRPFR